MASGPNGLLSLAAVEVESCLTRSPTRPAVQRLGPTVPDARKKCRSRAFACYDVW